MLVDTHCHLMLDSFQPDLDQVLDRARNAGVQRIVVPGIDLKSSRRALDLAEATPGVYAAVGVHPHETESWSAESADELRAMAASAAVVAIGETGLDYYRDLSPRTAQLTALREQLYLAAEMRLPVIVHNRESTDDLLAELSRWADELPNELASRTGVLHAFSADRESAKTATELGFYLGVAGSITYPNADDRRQVTAAVPADRLLIETDAPYMAPQAERGKRNEPAFVRFVAEALADVKSSSLNEVAESTTANASNLFGWRHGTTNGNLL